MTTAVTTAEELIRRLSPDGVRNMKTDMLTDVLDAAAEQARTDAPKRRGFGSPKSIVSRIKPYVVKPGVWGVVRSGAPHSHLMEGGTQAHPLRPVRKRRGRSGVMRIFGSEMILRRGAQHPGTGARPFLRTAPTRARGEIDDIMADSGEQLFTDTRYWRRRTRRGRG